MGLDKLAGFERQNYLNLETFRKNGEGVKTPVWFMRCTDVLYVRTIQNSGKVKRIRRNANVRIVPCSNNGKVLGEWVEAEVLETKDPRQVEEAAYLANKKYGFFNWIFSTVNRLSRNSYATLVIRLK